MAVLRVDAHVTIVEAALKGYMKWFATQESEDPQKDASSTPGQLSSYS